MSNADGWFFAIAFSVVTLFLHGIRDRLNRIEKKLDKMGDK
jgi:hypothetical protein